jgi:hypothetical protein
MAEFKLGRIRFIWKGSWQPSTIYYRDDVVNNGGISYICVSGHNSSSLFTTDEPTRWEKVATGQEWKSNWQVSTYYKENDIVSYGGKNYIANTSHTSSATTTLGLEENISNWDLLSEGIDYKGFWTQTTRYKLNDLVKYGGTIWICITPHTSQTDLVDDEIKWAVFVNGIIYEGIWNSATQYKIGDVIEYGGNNYIAITNNLNSNPFTAINDWKLFSKNFNFRGSWSSVENYAPGDVITHGGYTYLSKTINNDEVPPNSSYWEQLNSGIDWKDEWANGTTYILGDAARYGGNSYICISPHTSDSGTNRPDIDINGNFWNLLSGGPENNVLTTEGDLVYYSQSGPTRLPVGKPGQLLVVKSDGSIPEWQFLNQIDHIYYVETSNGVDSPAPIYGTTLDFPWKTIRYAAQEIEKGPLKQNAKKLLLVNRAFIQAETVEWVDYQITNNISPFTNSFTYDKELYRRDVGFIIDALRHDISHGGNIKSREAALAYFNGNTSYIIGQEAETIAAINYALSLIEKVLDNTAPTQNYQTLNSVPSPITQVINNLLVQEDGTFTTITSLVEIITDTINDGNTNGLPVAYKPHSSIFVKTGQFNEVLPIIVPENCAVIGDELRSTKIIASGSVIDVSDVPYSLDALQRLQDIISDIIQNNVIIKSSGNIATQVTSRPAGSSTAGNEAATLIDNAKSLINYRINNDSTGSEPILSGSNSPRGQTEFTYAVEVLEANRDFIKSEIEAFISSSFPSYTYNVAQCLNDIDKYIDAVQYDLIYQGNYKTLVAARYYINAVLGSTLENMFLLRNASGLRNCTLNGLNGTLSIPNPYGTRRPTAGAYASLDPGWGPNDTKVWILTRSPYVQNVSTFGTGCIGLKVDGALHDGGNDSIVANDFTQLISDGIGAWVTNLGRAELVSVFTYYNHIGYLSENGGKIRATNGNNSYGDFGSVSEGVDVAETPITAEIDNRFFPPQIERVFTNGNKILTFEYSHAGQDYTTGSVTFSVTGAGFGEVVDESQVVNGGVFEVRLLDNNDDSSGQFGGEGFTLISNSAQGGNTTSITIANTDIAQTNAYDGMAIYIISGKGAGQYGYIGTYNSGTKIATVFKESDGSPGWDHLIGDPIESTLDTTTTYSIEPRVVFTAPSLGTTASGRAIVEDGKIVVVTIINPGSGYTLPPTITFTDPGKIFNPPYQVRVGDGVLTQPTWTNRGSSYVTARATVVDDESTTVGFADIYQPGTLIRVKNMSNNPRLGSNIEFANIPGKIFKLVFIRDLIGAENGPFTAELQVSPALEIFEAPDHEESLEFRIRYSQVRLTGHDFLEIGTGNFNSTNYPDQPQVQPIPANEIKENNGGRVFFTSTDQDGNFRVGQLFSVEQSTGLATLDVQAFNLTGLQELSLGELGLGSSGTVITEFSTDGTFSANSDNIIPTQRAIRTYITSQIGGGAATLNVNSVTAGDIQISGQQITTISGNQINFNEEVNFAKGILGVPVAMNYFLR